MCQQGSGPFAQNQWHLSFCLFSDGQRGPHDLKGQEACTGATDPPFPLIAFPLLTVLKVTDKIGVSNRKSEFVPRYGVIDAERIFRKTSGCRYEYAVRMLLLVCFSDAGGQCFITSFDVTRLKGIGSFSTSLSVIWDLAIFKYCAASSRFPSRKQRMACSVSRIGSSGDISSELFIAGHVQAACRRAGVGKNFTARRRKNFGKYSGRLWPAVFLKKLSIVVLYRLCKV